MRASHRGRASVTTASSATNGHSNGHSNGHTNGHSTNGHSHASGDEEASYDGDKQPLLFSSSNQLLALLSPASPASSRAPLWTRVLTWLSLLLVMAGLAVVGYQAMTRDPAPVDLPPASLVFVQPFRPIRSAPSTPALPSFPAPQHKPEVSPFVPQRPSRVAPPLAEPPIDGYEAPASSAASNVIGPSARYPRPAGAIPAATTTAHHFCRPMVDGRQQMSFVYFHVPLLPHHHAMTLTAQVAIYDVNVDLNVGIVSAILWDRPQGKPFTLTRNGVSVTKPDNQDVWYANWQSLTYFYEQALRGDFACHVLQAGQPRRSLEKPRSPDVQWQRPNITRIELDSWNWLECRFDPALGPPVGIQFLYYNNLTAQHEVVEKTICEYELPRTFATGLIKGLYNEAPLHLHLIYDYVGYCLRLGIDFFYVLDQTEDQELLIPFQPLIQRGIVQYLWWPEADGIRVQFAQTQVYHLWNAHHSLYGYPADIDEYIHLPNSDFTLRPCLFEPCPSPLKALLTSERYSRYVALEMFAVVFPMWEVPAKQRAAYPQDDFRYQHNESYYRDMAYHGQRTSDEYLPHQARNVWHSTLPCFDNDRKTMYMNANVTLVRTHDVFTYRQRHDVYADTKDEQYFQDIHIAHYRHIFRVRPLQLEHDNVPQFWDNVVRDDKVANIMLQVPYPTPMADFESLYPICAGEGWTGGVETTCESASLLWQRGVQPL